MDDRRDLDRRSFLARAVGGAGLAWLSAVAASVRLERAARAAPTPEGAAPKVLTPAEWRTLEAAQDTLLPSEPDAPGARDVRATAYLDAALADPDTEPPRRDLVRSGAAALDRLARDAGATDFAALDEAGRDRAVEAYARSDEGAAWVDATLAFTLEAMLGDPVHDANPGEVGWRWVGHVPGEPRPARKAQEGGR